MRRKKFVTVKLSEDEATMLLAGLDDLIVRFDKLFVGSPEWQEERKVYTALGRRIDLAALDAGWNAKLNAPTRQIIYEDA